MPRDHDRALAVGFIIFIAMLTIAAVLFILLDPAATQVFDTSSEVATNSQATDAIDERADIWGKILFYAMFLSGVFIIARAVREQGR